MWGIYAEKRKKQYKKEIYSESDKKLRQEGTSAKAGGRNHIEPRRCAEKEKRLILCRTIN